VNKVTDEIRLRALDDSPIPDGVFCQILQSPAATIELPRMSVIRLGIRHLFTRADCEPQKSWPTNGDSWLCSATTSNSRQRGSLRVVLEGIVNFVFGRFLDLDSGSTVQKRPTAYTQRGCSSRHRSRIPALWPSLRFAVSFCRKVSSILDLPFSAQTGIGQLRSSQDSVELIRAKPNQEFFEISC